MSRRPWRTSGTGEEGAARDPVALVRGKAISFLEVGVDDGNGSSRRKSHLVIASATRWELTAIYAVNSQFGITGSSWTFAAPFRPSTQPLFALRAAARSRG